MYVLLDMTTILYEPWKPNAEALAIIRTANSICSTYALNGYDLTLRQLYYQFVAKHGLRNNIQSYKKLGSIINKARLAGLMDWDYIVDRTRGSKALPHAPNPQSHIKAAADRYYLDHWAGQHRRVEVWVEKEALISVIERVAGENDVTSFACRGYVSQSELWAAGQRIGGIIERGQGVVVIHLGDHDPSGLDMSRDMAERLRTFVYQDYFNNHGSAEIGGKKFGQIIDHATEWCGGYAPFELRRIALNMDQVDQYDPPPNPAKLTDSRVGKYLEQYGEESWELDALDPDTLHTLIQDEIDDIVDRELYDGVSIAQREHRRLIRAVGNRWDDVVATVES